MEGGPVSESEAEEEEGEDEEAAKAAAIKAALSDGAQVELDVAPSAGVGPSGHSTRLVWRLLRHCV
jgi:hypothetical protein